VDSGRQCRCRAVTVAAVTEVWALPGYDVQALIGYGATGEVWRARELSSGAAVALKRLRDGADLSAIESLRREASVLRSLDTPYVVRLRAVLGEGADTVLVLDLATGGSLAALLARRGSLDPGEVVTIAAPLAQALAAAHASGLVHGDVTPSNVLFTAEGMPLLADLGLARLAGVPLATVDGTAEYVDPTVASGGQPDAASDVWALAAVCHHLLSGTPPHDGVAVDDVLDAARAGARAPLGLLAPLAPRPLVSAIEQALQADPALRPAAAEFASAIRRSHAAAPVRLTGGVVAAAPGPDIRPTHAVHTAPPPAAVETPSDGSRRRVLVIAAAAVALLSVAACIGWLSGRSGSVRLSSIAAAAPDPSASTAAPRDTGAAASSDWRVVLDALDRGRAEAFAAGVAGQLRETYAAGSPLLASDRAAIERLRSAGQTARGVRHTIRSVTVVSDDGRVAVLRTIDVLAAYDVLDASGRVVQRSAERASAAFVVTLDWTGAGWRLQQITRA
jgi:hypothetical protein